MLCIRGLVPNIHKLVTTKTLSYILLNNIHQQFTCSVHATILAKDVIHVARYILIRVRHELAKDTNQDNMRQKLSRLIIFQNI